MAEPKRLKTFGQILDELYEEQRKKKQDRPPIRKLDDRQPAAAVIERSRETEARTAARKQLLEMLDAIATVKLPNSFKEYEEQQQSMAGSTLAANKRVTQVPIVYEGTAITLPEGMTKQDAIRNLERQINYENETTAFIETVECFPWDGAVALNRVLMRRYGWAQAEPTPGFFGKEPPKMIGIDIGPTQTIQIPWGRFSLPNITGWIATGSAQRDGRIIFAINAEVLRKNEGEIKAIADEVRTEVRLRSIYRGKSIKMKFTDNDGNAVALPWPKFLDVSQVNADDLIYSDQVNNSVHTNLITPLEHYDQLANYGIPFKRGVLLAGVYGVGKTLAAFYAANRANAHGITFVYVEKAVDFSSAVTFARQYLPAVVFCEDIDRVTAGTRDEQMDSILNTMDGIDAKSSELMVVLTTNEVTAIHQGMLRPGRLDAIIEVLPPDAKAVIRLIKLYGRGLLDPTSDLNIVGELLKGEIPAVVREVVERAKLAAIRLQSIQGGSLVITTEALVDSAYTMKGQIELLNRSKETPPSELERMGTAMGKSMGKGLEGLAEALASGHRFMIYDQDDSTIVGDTVDAVPSGAMAALAEANDEQNHRPTRTRS